MDPDSNTSRKAKREELVARVPALPRPVVEVEGGGGVGVDVRLVRRGGERPRVTFQPVPSHC